MTVYAGETIQANKARLEEEIMLIKEELNKLMEERGEWLVEKAKTKWFNEGEKANKYFLNLLQQQEGKLRMNELEVDQVTITGDDNIRSIVTEYYTDLYSARDTENIEDGFLDLIDPVDSNADDEVSKPITYKELAETLR